MAIYKQFHKAWGITGQIGQEYRWEKDLKWSPMTSVLKGRECPKGSMMERPCVNSTRGQWDKGTQEISSAGQLPQLEYGDMSVVFIQLLFEFSESISHKRHHALLAEIIRTVRSTAWLPSGRRQDSRPETAPGGQHGEVLTKVFSFHLGC